MAPAAPGGEQLVHRSSARDFAATPIASRAVMKMSVDILWTWLSRVLHRSHFAFSNGSLFDAGVCGSSATACKTGKTERKNTHDADLEGKS
jgi:hypothetical protein